VHVAAWAVASTVLTVSGCASRSATTPTTLAPLVTPLRVVTTTAPPTTQPDVTTPDGPLVSALPDATCGWADPLPGGEVTFVAGDRLYGVAPDGAGLHCLTTLKTSQRVPLRWSPHGERALFDNGTLLDATGRHDTGVKVDPLRTRFVPPDDTSVLVPTSSGKGIVQRSVTGTGAKADVTFLATTDLAEPHPAGAATVASGVSAAGRRGVFAAISGDPTAHLLLTVAKDGPQVTELALDAGGHVAYLVAAGDTSYRLVRLDLGSLATSEVTSEHSPLSDVVVGPVEGTTAWRTGLCNSVTAAWVLDDRTGSPVTVGAGSELDGLSVTPIGWLDAGRLVVAARPLGCTGRADLWVWNLLDGSSTLIVRAVDAAAVRSIAEVADPLVLDGGATPQAL
jgi:hypothetical protein